jgi:hypothetical protein
MLGGWIRREQVAVVAYQKEEIRALREMLGGMQLRFTDTQRRRLALTARSLSHAKRCPGRPPEASTLNAFVEWFNPSMKQQCLERVIRLGEAPLREFVRQYVAPCPEERPHQGAAGQAHCGSQRPARSRSPRAAGRTRRTPEPRLPRSSVGDRRRSSSGTLRAPERTLDVLSTMT